MRALPSEASRRHKRYAACDHPVRELPRPGHGPSLGIGEAVDRPDPGTLPEMSREAGVPLEREGRTPGHRPGDSPPRPGMRRVPRSPSPGPYEPSVADVHGAPRKRLLQILSSVAGRHGQGAASRDRLLRKLPWPCAKPSVQPRQALDRQDPAPLSDSATSTNGVTTAAAPASHATTRTSRACSSCSSCPDPVRS